MKRLIRSAPVRVLTRLVRKYFEDGVARGAAELAYYLLFSIFPFIVFINGLLSRFNLDIDELIEQLDLILPPEIVGIFTDYLDYITGLNAGVMLYSGLFLTFFMVLRAVGSLTRSVAKASGQDRHGVFYFVVSLAMSLLLLVSIFALFALIMLSGNLLDALGRHIRLSDEFLTLVGWLRYLVAPSVMLLVLAAYYGAVGARRFSLKRSVWGALFFMTFWVLATAGFSYYVSNMSNYSLLYGSIGAIMILMLWLYLTGILLIMGGALNHTLEIEVLNKKDESL